MDVDLILADRVLNRLVEQWQLGGIFSWTSGAPLNITAPISTITQAAVNMPVIVGNFPKSTGKVTPVEAGATYFPGFTQVADPARNNVTTAQALDTRFSNRAIADAQGTAVKEMSKVVDWAAVRAHVGAAKGVS